MTEVVEINKIKEEHNKVLKPIKLVKYINNRVDVVGFSTAVNLTEWDFVMLICKGHNKDFYDVIMCWDSDNMDDKSLYFGFWNDGVVE